MNLPDKYALYIGNAYPHKNLEFLVSSWEQIYSQTKMPLVLAGGRSIFYDRLEKVTAGKNYVEHIDFVENIQEIYSKATLFVFPTLMEGFGLPPLEATKNNLPVICSDLPVLREVLGDAPIYFDPKNQSDLVEKCLKVLSDQSLRQSMVAKGLEQVNKYSWSKMAHETLEVYKSIVDRA